MKERELKVGDELDLVEVVRCKDCKHSSIAFDDGQQFCEKEGEWRDQDFFCKWGKRKEGDGDGN